jgi:murein DD-endopeptidase MepM/ murein hydrolase activator NlpD
MRPLLAIIGASTLAAAAAIAMSLPRSQPTAETPGPAPTALVYATADPSVTSRVVPQEANGRVAVDDRVDRTRRSVSGLALPIDGVGVPTDPELLPNAARDFRAGWHEGIDFPAAAGTPVRAVAAGTIVRIDREFTDWTPAEEDAALAAAVAIGYTPSATLDRIRGRQVWIDHGNGVVSRYAHLSGVAALRLGDAVETGTVVGFVGSTGFPEGGPHLHLEIRLGTTYLGDGLSGDALVAAITSAFAPSDEGSPRSR